MAFENLRPHRPLIESLKRDGKSLSEIVEALDAKRCGTTPATLSRYLKEIGQPYRPRELTAQERPIVDQTVLLTEIFAEVQGAKAEQRAVIESLAGKVAVLTATIEELEKALTTSTIVSVCTPSAVHTAASGALDPSTLRRVWARAFLVTLAVNAAIAGAVIARGL